MTDRKGIRDEIEKIDLTLRELLKHRTELVRKAYLQGMMDLPNDEETADAYRKSTLEFGLDLKITDDVCISVSRGAAEIPGKTSSHRHIAVIGGNGNMGKWLERFFRTSGHTVDIIDPSADNGFILKDAANADTVVVSVPISAVDGILRKLDGICNADTLIFDITSLKTPFIDTLKNMAKTKKICSVHPMFGPSAVSMSGRNILVCDCGDCRAVKEACDLMGVGGGNVNVIDAERHDVYMSYVLGLSHAINIAFFTVLERSGISLRDMKSVASTTYNKMMDTNRSVALENPDLYYEIQHLNGNRDKMLEEFEKSVRDVMEAASDDNPDRFRELMDRGRRYFTE